MDCPLGRALHLHVGRIDVKFSYLHGFGKLDAEVRVRVTFEDDVCVGTIVVFEFSDGFFRCAAASEMSSDHALVCSRAIAIQIEHWMQQNAHLVPRRCCAQQIVAFDQYNPCSRGEGQTFRDRVVSLTIVHGERDRLRGVAKCLQRLGERSDVERLRTSFALPKGDAIAGTIHHGALVENAVGQMPTIQAHHRKVIRRKDDTSDVRQNTTQRCFAAAGYPRQPGEDANVRTHEIAQHRQQRKVHRLELVRCDVDRRCVTCDVERESACQGVEVRCPRVRVLVQNLFRRRGHACELSR